MTHTPKGFISQDSSLINLTLKNYKSFKGVATQLHNATVDSESKDSDGIYMIKGPMGRGLELSESSTGHHFVFCAGTAILIFLDIVSNMILDNSYEFNNQKPPEDVQRIPQTFILHLYVAFASRKESIGLEILEALEKLNKKIGKTNFILNVRFSTPDNPADKKPRWDAKFIEQELTPFSKEIKRVWICGPPVMNELFDRTMEGLQEKLGLKPHQIDVL